MNDPNHTWNTGKPIRSRKQLCGCHITAKIFELCVRGRDLKQSADSWYGLWQSQKDSEIDPVAIRSFLHNFNVHKKAYIKHLATGKDWCIG